LRRPGRLVRGAARRPAAYGFPPADLCLTGAPFCTLDETADPLTWYAAPGRGYGAYLADLQAVFRQVAALLRPGAAAVVEVANLRQPGGAAR
jgi:hypothetical protein